MRKFTVVLLAVAAGLPGLLPADARFVDPLPFRFDPILSVTAAGGLHIVGQEGGLVTALNAGTGEIRWSASTFAPVAALAVLDGRVLVGNAPATGPGTLRSLDLADGEQQWVVQPASGVRSIAVAGDAAFLVLQDGTGARFSHESGAFLWSSSLGAPGHDVAAAGTRVAVAAAERLFLLDASTGTQTGSAPVPARRLALTDTSLYAVANETLRWLELQGPDLSERVVPGHVLANLTAVSTGFGRVVTGDKHSRIFTYSEDLSIAVPAIATYANVVNDIQLLSAEEAAVAFYSGWMGHVPLKDQPVVLILWPPAARYTTNPVAFEWAYALPGANPDRSSTVQHTIQIRLAGEAAWRTVATGTAPVERLTLIHRAPVDLGPFPSGTRFESRILLKDERGREGQDLILNAFVLDLEPPSFTRDPRPAAGAVTCEYSPTTGTRICTNRPTIMVAHRDEHSGIDPAATRLWVDGSGAGWTIENGRSLTVATPLQDLAEGRHDWKLEIRDVAGNLNTLQSHFVVDSQPPKVLEPSIDHLTARLAALSFRTDEPARCTTSAGDGAGRAEETAADTEHSVVLDGLTEDTPYTATAECTDAAGQTGRATVASFTTPHPPGPAPRLVLSWTPAAPDGQNGWFVAPGGVRLSAGADASDASVQWSLDAAPFSTFSGDALLPNGTHTVRLYAARPDGSASPLETHVVKSDPSPAPDPVASWSPTLGLLEWSTLDDPESGVARFVIETRSAIMGGQFRPLQELPWPDHRFEEMPPGVEEARVVAVNGAGQRSPGSPVTVGTGADVAHSIAGVANRTVPLNADVRVNVRLAQNDQFIGAVLRNRFGVDREFSSTITLGPRFLQAYAKASSFAPGPYEAFVRVMQAGSTVTLPAGNLTIVESPATTTATSGATGTASPPADSPAVEGSLLLLLVGLAAAMGRRRR